MKRLLALTMGLLVCAAAPAAAQDDVASFYKGKIVRLVVGIGVGSGYDINARLLARYLPKYIPGNPSVIVQNQPGAGSLTMTNQLYAGGPFDGTAIGASFNGLPTTPLLQPVGARFDATKLNWVGSTNRETQAMYVWAASPINSLADLTTKEMIVGAQAPGSTQYDYPKLAEKLFGWKFKVITGYEATPKIHLAMERGEVDGLCSLSWTTIKTRHAEWLKAKKINLIAQTSFKKVPEIGDVPLMMDQTKDKEKLQILKIFVGAQQMARPFAAPPGIPADRKAALVAAFDATMKDPEYLEDAKKLELDVNPVSGKAIDSLLAEVYATPKDVLRKAGEMATK